MALPIWGEQAVEDEALAWINACFIGFFPDGSLMKDGLQLVASVVEAAVEAGDEPADPIGDVATTELGGFELGVVITTLGGELAGEAVKAVRDSIAFGQSHVSYGAADTTVAIVEGMDGDKPEMGDRCT